MKKNAINYQKLIAKDSTDVTSLWRGVIIVILLLLIISGFTATFSFHSVLLNFNSNCILRANVVLTKIKLNESGSDGHTIIPFERKLLIEFEQINKKLIEKERVKEPILSGIKPLYTIFKVKDKDNLKKDNDTQFGVFQQNLELFKTETIDEANTRWGSLTSCEYLSFVPFLEAIVAIIWLMLFVICGRGGSGYRTNALIEEPWRLVVPAIVFFIIMSFIAIVYLSITQTKLHQFCNEFQSIFSNISVPCGLVMDRFSLFPDTSTDPSTNYYLTIWFAWIMVFLWCCTILIMCLRCICGPDFKLVNVTIATVDDYQVIEDKFGNEND